MNKIILKLKHIKNIKKNYCVLWVISQVTWCNPEIITTFNKYTIIFEIESSIEPPNTTNNKYISVTTNTPYLSDDIIDEQRV